MQASSQVFIFLASQKRLSSHLGTTVRQDRLALFEAAVAITSKTLLIGDLFPSLAFLLRSLYVCSINLNSRAREARYRPTG